MSALDSAHALSGWSIRRIGGVPVCKFHAAEFFVMKKSIDPNAGAVQLRLGPPLLKLIEDWRRAQIKIPPRSEAVRQLVQLALVATQRPADAEKRV
jgi:hypothetical protein